MSLVIACRGDAPTIPGRETTSSPLIRICRHRVIEEHIRHAERFDMEPGKLFYWPSNRWHVVVSDQRPFVVAQFSAYFNPADVDQT